MSLIDHCYPATQKKGGVMKTKRPGSIGKFDEGESSTWDHTSHALPSAPTNLEKV